MDADNTLIKRYKGGDLMAFETLYRKYKNPIYYYIYSIIKIPAATEEIMQDIFTEFISRIDTIKTQGNFRNWLYVSARNRAINYLKREKIRRNPATTQIELVEPQPSDQPEEPLVKAEETKRVNACLSQLPDEQREVILLKIYNGLSFKEIAQLINESIGTISSRYNYGLEKMRLLLNGTSTN